ncbi:uncharacterized protein LOC110056611 [Orbicella faveolata]|uniref:uncharacterized protein LOC110056611 n=1 Tax=Orbicella faveolata TaxID=48498 RepID=UPI0009E223F5|nr:uncharacterized protein LOC110056611 [Orbicella faveolata]
MALVSRFLRCHLPVVTGLRSLINSSRAGINILPSCQVPFKRWYFRAVPLAPPPKPKPLDIETLPSYGVFSPSVCKFISVRDYENRDSGILAWVTSLTGEDPLGIIELNEFVFGTNPRIDILHRVVVWQRAKKRAGTAKVKNRSERRGGGRKPWRQKGTGRARQGSIRAPQWRKGGRVHGPVPRSYKYSLPKKVRRMGLRTALSVRYAQGDLHIVDSFDDIESDRDLIPLLEKRGWTDAVLVDSKQNEILVEAAAEMERVDVLCQKKLDVYTILLRRNIILTLDAVQELEDYYCEDDRILRNQFD